MKILRTRKPGLKSTLGVTKAKKRIKKATGITTVAKPLRVPGNIKRQVNREVGYCSPSATSGICVSSS